MTKGYRKSKETLRHGLPSELNGIAYELFIKQGRLHVRFLDTGKDLPLPLHAMRLSKNNWMNLSRPGIAPNERISMSAISSTTEVDLCHYFGMESDPSFFNFHLTYTAPEIVKYHFFLGSIIIRDGKVVNIVFKAKMAEHLDIKDQAEMVKSHIEQIDQNLIGESIVISIWAKETISTFKYTKKNNELKQISQRERRSRR